MTRQLTHSLLMTVFATVILTVTASPVQAETNKHYEDCVADAADHCRAKCDDELGFDAVDCARSCLEDMEGQCEEYDTESYDSSGSDGECEDCMDLCENACDRILQSWRRNNCLSECKSRCDNVCD